MTEKGKNKKAILVLVLYQDLVQIKMRGSAN